MCQFILKVNIVIKVQRPRIGPIVEGVSEDCLFGYCVADKKYSGQNNK